MNCIALNNTTLAPVRLSLWTRVREELRTRRENRQFERAVGRASRHEANDLMAMHRRG